MIFRLHSTPEINTPALLEYLMVLYFSDRKKAIVAFQQGFKSIPLSVIIGVLESEIRYSVENNVVIINTKERHNDG